MKHLKNSGHDVDAFFFARKGSLGIETFNYDAPITGWNIKKVSKDNLIYDYLDHSIGIYTVPYKIFNRTSFAGLLSFLKDIRVIYHLNALMKRGAYDQIYIIVHDEFEAYLCRMLKKRKLKNVIVAYHEVVNHHIGKPALKKVVKQTEKLGYPVITYSEHTKHLLVELSGNSNVSTVYFGPFETYKIFDSKRPIVKDKYVLFIGHILPYKGLPFLYETIKEYGINEGVKVVIAGSGHDEALEFMKNDNRFIVINRFLSDCEFANLTKFANCIVCPYISGSQSGITHTAMVFGTPVIATRTGAFPEFIESGKNGELVDYGDKKSLYSAIVKYTESDKHNCHIPQHLRWSNIVKRFNTLLIQQV